MIIIIMEVEDQELLDAASDNAPASDATDNSSAGDPVTPDNAAGNRLSSKLINY